MLMTFYLSYVVLGDKDRLYLQDTNHNYKH
jgi:hypothetical protein